MGKNEMGSVVSLVELEAQFRQQKKEEAINAVPVALASAKCEYAERHGTLMPTEVAKKLISILTNCHREGSVKIVEKFWGFGSDFFSDLGNGREIEWRYCLNQSENARNPWILLYATRRDRIVAALEAAKLDSEVRSHLERFLRNVEIVGYLRIVRGADCRDTKETIHLDDGRILRIAFDIGTDNQMCCTTCRYVIQPSNMFQRIAAYVAIRTGLIDKKEELEKLFCGIEICEDTQIEVATNLLEMLPSLKAKQKQILGTSKEQIRLIESGKIPPQMFAIKQEGKMTVYLPAARKKGFIGTFYPFF